MVQKQIDGVSFALGEDFDFSFLAEFGRVFKVFDQQDSGCICFGVQSPQGRLFIKFAGARTLRAAMAPDAAISTLRRAAANYEVLRHENLIRLIRTREIGGGFAAIFEWTDAECMGEQYQSRHKFFALPVEDRLAIFGEILNFHLLVAEKGYVAVDFYDGCIMYDFDTRKTVLCDIDFYAPCAFVNEMGVLWGSSRFMSPEESERGATIDELSNVFMLGATAFNLLGDPRSRTRERWAAGERLFDVAARAASDSRALRYASIAEFAAAWRSAG